MQSIIDTILNSDKEELATELKKAKCRDVKFLYITHENVHEGFNRV